MSNLCIAWTGGERQRSLGDVAGPLATLFSEVYAVWKQSAGRLPGFWSIMIATPVAGLKTTIRPTVPAAIEEAG